MCFIVVALIRSYSLCVANQIMYIACVLMLIAVINLKSLPFILKITRWLATILALPNTSFNSFKLLNFLAPRSFNQSSSAVLANGYCCI